MILGGASGAWGDSSFAVSQLLDDGRCGYILFEALAEITMGILTRARSRNPHLGYATDVIEMIGRELPRIVEQNARVITNAGGIHPEAAAALLRARAEAHGIHLRIACIEGDNLLGRVDALRSLGVAEMREGTPLVDSPLSFNAYLGARPIAAALDAGADVVVTGRCVDSALALGPLIHEFGWEAGDFDRLSQGSLAGHLLECGPQATGGILTDSEDVQGWDDPAYPIAECFADGSFLLTKPARSGGLVDVRTAAEQLLYEIGDPSAYLLPDVTCDWRFVTLQSVGPDRVSVRGARGTPPSGSLKACAQTNDGYKVTALLFIAGRDATRKAERFAEALLKRVARLLVRDGYAPLRAHDVEVLGAEATYGPHAEARGTREVVVKVALHHDDREALAAAIREVGSFGMVVPGLTGGGTGLPRPTPVIRLHSYLVPRDRVDVRIALDGSPVPYDAGSLSMDGYGEPRAVEEIASMAIDDPVEAPLVAIAHARSGDKGPDSNIGVRARHPDFLPVLRQQLSAAVVARWFAHRLGNSQPVEDAVLRYDLPGIDALNFVLRDSLGGGGIGSLRFDPQGKAYAQQLLDMPVSIPRAWLEHPSLRPFA
ncbi:MAG: acyclic terpene utilization AtuA family protein [Myxococcota bacterium]